MDYVVTVSLTASMREVVDRNKDSHKTLKALSGCGLEHCICPEANRGVMFSLMSLLHVSFPLLHRRVEAQ